VAVPKTAPRKRMVSFTSGCNTAVTAVLYVRKLYNFTFLITVSPVQNFKWMKFHFSCLNLYLCLLSEFHFLHSVFQTHILSGLFALHYHVTYFWVRLAM
jgi:hypothetical protein